MPIAWLQPHSALVFFLYFPWFPFSPPLPPEAQPQTVAVEAGVAGEPQTIAPAAEEPLVLPGVVIEEIPKDSALEKAGLQVGDVILSWERLPNPGGARGELISYFDWLELEVEQVPRGAVVLRGRRGRESLELRGEPGIWNANIRPYLSQRLEKIYLAGKTKLASGEIEAAVVVWQSMANSMRGEGTEDLKAWVTLQIGAIRGDNASWAEAIEAYNTAIEAAGNSAIKVAAWEALGGIQEKRNEYQDAEHAYSSALGIRQMLNPRSLGCAKDLNSLGEATGDRGDLNLAHDYFSQAFEIIEHAAPHSLLLAKTLINLGMVAQLRGDLDRAQNLFLRALAIRQQLAPLSADTAESLNNLGGNAETRSDFDTAYTYHLKALEIRQKLDPGGLSEAQSLSNLGVLCSARGQLDAALKYYHRALQIREQRAPQSLALATSLHNLGTAYKARGELSHARDYFIQALEIRQKIAPQSLVTASSLSNLGEVAWKQGEAEQAKQLFGQAFAICKKVAPQSLDAAKILNNLGAVAVEVGDPAQAAEYLLQALQIQKLRSPYSRDTALSLANLGALNQEQGELDHAYDYFYQAFKIQEKLTPESLTLARFLSNIGGVMRFRGELDRAHDYYQRALQIQEKIAPESLDMASSLNKLGILSQERGELDHALDYYSHALRIRNQLDAQNLEVAAILNNLGTLAQLQGRPENARDYHLRALEIKNRLAPRSLSVSTSLNNLGKLAYSLGELDRAHDYYLQALKTTEDLAYQSLEKIISLHGLGTIAQARREFPLARDYLLRALNTMEHQISKLGGSYDVQTTFRTQRGKYYYNLLDLFLAQGSLPDAFQTLERFRAQTFLSMLAERDTAFSADIPEELDQERLQLAAQYDRTLKKVTNLNLQDNGEKINSIRRELQKLDYAAGDLEVRIRKASPRLAALKYPHPLDVPEARQALDPGTLLLSYSVREKQTTLFILSRSGDLGIKTLAVGKEDLQSRVKQLLSLINETGKGSSLRVLRQRQAQAASRELYISLLGPVADQIAASERLLILPDGPLHALPFAALIRDTSDQYLVEWKPLHIALSATVFAELKQRRHPTSEGNPPKL